MSLPRTGLLVVLLTAGVTAAASSRKAVVPALHGERFGFETRSGRLVIRPHFEMVTPFRDGRAAAQRGGRWGFLDDEGRWVGQPRYDWIHPQHFDEGPALVSAHGLYGFLDRDGAEVVPLSLQQATPFRGGVACVQPPDAPGFGLIDGEGRPLTGFTFDACDPRFDSERARVRQGSRWGYVDRSGEVVLPVRYDRAEPFSEGLALVEEGGLRAYIDPEGQRVIPANGEDAGSFHQGRAWIRYGADQVGFIDRTGQRVGPARWRAARDFAEGVAWVQDPGSGRWGLVDREGAVVLAPTYDDPGPFVEGRARVGRDGTYGFVDPRGEVVVPLRYESVGTFSEGRVAASTERGGKQAILDERGRALTDEAYDQVGPFIGGVARVTACRWVVAGALQQRKERVCDVFFVDREGKERR